MKTFRLDLAAVLANHKPAPMIPAKLITVDELFGETRGEDRISGAAADVLRLLLGKG